MTAISQMENEEMDKETLIERNTIHRLETAIEISSGTVRLSKEDAIAVLALLKERKQKAVKPTHKCVDGYMVATDPYLIYCSYCGKPIIGRKNKR